MINSRITTENKVSKEILTVTKGWLNGFSSLKI